MKKNVLLLAVGIIFSWQSLGLATSTVDALIKKLEDKGILTTQEATQIEGEIASQQEASQQKTFKSMLPEWVSGLKVSGDFRLRDQMERRDVANGSTSSHLQRNRGRIRARINFEDQLNDKLKLIVGIATNGENAAGLGNPRSNNITFGGNNTGEGSFNKPTLVLNKAYAVYMPASYATLMGGKMDNPFWEPASLLWDPNITPEGGVVQLQKKLNEYITPFATNAFLILKDASPSTSATAFKTDPYMFVSQEGIKGNLTDKLYYKGAFSLYAVVDRNHVVLDNRPSATGGSGTNNTNTMTSTASTNYAFNYYLVGGAVDFGINDPFGELLPSPIYIPQVGLFGQYFKNLNPSHQNTAWQVGAYMGNSAINGFGTWKIQSYYKVLERDSWLDVFPEADFYSGATNTQGWRSELDLGLAKNVWMTLSWYRTNVYKRIDNLLNGATNDAAYSTRAPENLIQADVNFKF